MAFIFPDKQEFTDLKNGDIIGITQITIVTTGTDHIKLPPTTDAALLAADRTTADPTFYLSGNNSTQLNIDGSTVGTKFTATSLHKTMVNFGAGSTG